jgi:hypothetical protein
MASFSFAATLGWATQMDFAHGVIGQALEHHSMGHETVVCSIDIEVQTKREKVVVAHADGMRCDELTVFWPTVIFMVRGLLLKCGFCLDDSSSSNGNFDGAIGVEPPVHDVVIVANCRR